MHVAAESVTVFTEVERKLEAAIEGFFGAMFRGRVQPTEIARRLERELDERKVVGPNSVVAPNVFTATLHPDDQRELQAALAVVVPELEQFVTQIAAERSLRLAGRVTVTLEADAALKRGTMSITSSIQPTVSIPASEPAVAPGLITRGLLLREGDRAGAVVELGEELVIGRDESCGLRCDERSVSRRHARLQWDGEQTIVEDLGSTNGTFVNRQRVTRCRLKPGDTLRVGGRTFEYKVVRRL